MHDIHASMDDWLWNISIINDESLCHIKEAVYDEEHAAKLSALFFSLFVSSVLTWLLAPPFLPSPSLYLLSCHFCHFCHFANQMCSTCFMLTLHRPFSPPVTILTISCTVLANANASHFCSSLYACLHCQMSICTAYEPGHYLHCVLPIALVLLLLSVIRFFSTVTVMCFLLPVLFASDATVITSSSVQKSLYEMALFPLFAALATATSFAKMTGRARFTLTDSSLKATPSPTTSMFISAPAIAVAGIVPSLTILYRWLLSLTLLHLVKWH